MQYWTTEQEAFEKEKWYIQLFGREDRGTGILLNRTDGGEGSNTFLGRKHTEEAKRKIGNSKVGNTVWLGKTHSVETRVKLRELAISRGDSVSFEGRRHTQESKEKMSIAHTKTHCKRGHEFSGVIICNGVVQKLCRICINDRQRLRRQNEEKSTRLGRDRSGRFVSV